MIRAIIKGTRDDADMAAAARNLTILHYIDWPHAHEQVCKFHDADLPAVMRWFLETRGEAPFPVGTMLWYSGPEGGQSR